MPLWTKLVDSSHGRAKEPPLGGHARGGRFCTGCHGRIRENYVIVNGKFRCEECFELDVQLARIRETFPKNNKDAKRRENIARKLGMRQRGS
jgi:hypothetical protein